MLTLRWKRDCREVTYWPHARFSPGRLQFWVLHTFMPVLLTLNREAQVLHAGAIEVGGDIIAFTGESGSGKSTLVSWFLDQGHALVADDSLGLINRQGKVLGVPSHSYHRPYRNTEDLGMPAPRAATGPAPMGAVLQLQPVPASAPVRMTALTGVEAWRCLHAGLFTRLKFAVAEQFAELGTLAGSVRLYQLEVPQDLDRLPEVYAAVCSQLPT